MEFFPKTLGPPDKKRSSNNGSRSSTYSGSSYSGSSYSGSSYSGSCYSRNIYSGQNYVVNNLNAGNYSPKDRYSGSGYTVNNGNFPRDEHSRRKYPESIRSSSSRLNTKDNTLAISKTDKWLTSAAKAAGEVRDLGELLGEIPRAQMPGSILKMGGASAKVVFVVCLKCKEKFKDWREARHRKNCNYEYCKRCG